MSQNSIELMHNSKLLQKEFNWLQTVIHTRLNLYFKQKTKYKSIYEIPMNDCSNDPSVYAQVINHFEMNVQERIVILLALVPHVIPHLLDMFFIKNETYDRIFTEFGGVNGKLHNGFLPTGETIVFLLAGNNIQQRLQIYNLFSEDHFFTKLGMIKLEHNQTNEPLFSGVLQLSREYINYFTLGIPYHPHYSSKFPASRIETSLEWNDLVVNGTVQEDIDDILIWMKYNDALLNKWGLKKKIKRGYRTLFYGPPGTGKTLTASLLGKSMGLDVYKIDLSQVVSKYIGETEKNLANIFDQAESKNWILFFDEADALFGSRTQAKDSKDRHANQEVAYLLQRVEDYPGLIILATNLKNNIDEAFARRFQSIVYFPMPNAEERWKLWMNAFSNKSVLSPNIDMEEIAYEFELSGGAITNVVRYTSLKALSRNSNIIELHDLINGIKKELKKEGKTINYRIK